MKDKSEMAISLFEREGWLLNDLINHNHVWDSEQYFLVLGYSIISCSKCGIAKREWENGTSDPK